MSANLGFKFRDFRFSSLGLEARKGCAKNAVMFSLFEFKT